MSDFSNAIDTHVADADWERMAQNAGMTPQELKAKIVPALEAFAMGGQLPQALAAAVPVAAVPQVSLPASTAQNDCRSQTFEVSLFKIIGVAGELTLCGTTSSNWTAELKACLIVAGARVWCTSYKFDAHNLGICYSPDVGVAKRISVSRYSSGATKSA